MNILKMRPRGAAVLASIAIGVASSASAQSATRPSSLAADSAIQRILSERVKAGRGVGIVAGVVDNGKRQVIVAGAAGAPGVPLDGNTVFEIGSITKVFTGALLADMVARGEVQLSDPIARYLPPTVRVPSRNGREITLRDLATQTSGLPRLPRNMAPADAKNPYADYTDAMMYEFLSGYELTRDPGAQFEYSNLGVGLLGHVLARRAGKSYEQLLIERILGPLGMNDTRITLSESMKRRLAPGHDEAGSPTGNWDLPTFAGAGALRSTVNDMMKFIAANLDTSSKMGRVLATARTPAFDMPGGTRRIGLAWLTTEQDSVRMVWHNGGTGGYRTFLGLDEQARRGVVVLSNQQFSVDDIGGHLVNSRVPLAKVTARVVRTAITLPAATLDRYVGSYQLAPAFIIDITREGSSLFAQATGQGKLEIFAEAEGKFFFKAVDAQLTFASDTSGKAPSVTLHQNGRDVPGPRIR